ncbi:hypothetical protein GW17_00031652 [Ensete ventricosum]|nr:hypothetical protein GW17_00031652 [Ensete ventricosum]
MELPDNNSPKSLSRHMKVSNTNKIASYLPRVVAITSESHQITGYHEWALLPPPPGAAREAETTVERLPGSAERKNRDGDGDGRLGPVLPPLVGHGVTCRRQTTGSNGGRASRAAGQSRSR